MTLLDAYQFVPLEPGDGGLLRPCLLARKGAPASPAALTVLRTTPDALAYLGCLVDRKSRFHDWLEIWLQQPPPKTQPLGLLRPITDEAWAARWQALMETLARDFGTACFFSGWELQPGPLLRYGPQWEPDGSSVCLNPSGQHLALLRLPTLCLTEYAACVAGKKIELPASPRSELVNALAQADSQFDSRFFLAARGGAATRTVEALLLKLSVLRGAMSAARDFTRVGQVPLLHLTSDSFGVHLLETANGLAALWSAEVSLRHTGAAYPQIIATEDSRHFLTDATMAASIFQMPGLRQPLSAKGTVRIREVERKRAGKECVIHGTLTTAERLAYDPGDLLHLRLAIGGQAVDVAARWEESAPVLPGEFRFRTLPQPLDAALSAPEATAVFPNTTFTVLPLHSSPCDLYSLGVVALDLLCKGSKASLPQLLDEAMSLGQRVATEVAAGKSLAAALAATTETAKALSSANLLAENGTAQAIPPALWGETLAFILKLLTGAFSFSHCRHAGDAPTSALHAVYGEPLTELANLIDRVRGLLLPDWTANAEIRAELERW